MLFVFILLQRRNIPKVTNHPGMALALHFLQQGISLSGEKSTQRPEYADADIRTRRKRA